MPVLVGLVVDRPPRQEVVSQMTGGPPVVLEVQRSPIPSLASIEDEE